MEEGDDLGPLSIWILKLLLASIWGLPPSLACGMEIGQGERGGGGEVAGDGAWRRLWVGFGWSRECCGHGGSDGGWEGEERRGQIGRAHV